MIAKLVASTADKLVQIAAPEIIPRNLQIAQLADEDSQDVVLDRSVLLRIPFTTNGKCSLSALT